MNNEQNEILKEMRLQTKLLCAILAVVLIVGIFACVSFTRISQTMKGVDTDMINAAAESMKAAGDKIKSMDTDSLNGFLSSMEHAAENWENSSSFFSKIFGGN